MCRFSMLNLAKMSSFVEICTKLKEIQQFKTCDFLQRNVQQTGSVCPSVIHFLEETWISNVASQALLLSISWKNV